jgi:hypothetical protein
MPLKSVKLATMNESRLRIKLQLSEVPSVNFLREKVSRRLDSESLDPILGMIALCYWVFSPSETRFTVIPLVFALGSLTLFSSLSRRGNRFLARPGYPPTHIISNRVRRCYTAICFRCGLKVG